MNYDYCEGTSDLYNISPIRMWHKSKDLCKQKTMGHVDDALQADCKKKLQKLFTTITAITVTVYIIIYMKILWLQHTASH